MFLSGAAASAQAQVNEHHHIASGNAFGVPSNAYFARTPYTISWKADKSNQLYEQYGKIVKMNELVLEVYDVASGKLIAYSGWRPLQGEMKVAVGGKHHIRVYAPGKWTAEFKEDKEMLQRAAGRGELKDGVTVRDASQNSLRTKKDRVESVKNGMIKQLADSRDEFGESGVAALTADVHKAAHLASDELDFAMRFGALSKETMIRIREDQERNPPGNPQEPKPAPAVTQSSGWTGKGLPPGMQRREEGRKAD
ncbi:MAG: hypothetical protein V4584_16920 [Verrucomicrobiota bacterium]